MSSARAKSLRSLLRQKCPWIVQARDKSTMFRTYAKYYATILGYRIRHPRDTVFKTIYKEHTWGKESRSGSGSEWDQTSVIREEIPALLHDIGARSIVDAACGDFFWMAQMRLDVDSYVGVDIVPELIRENQKKYGNDRFRFVHVNLTECDLPKADIIICRDCLVHLSYKDIFRCLRTFKRSGSTYLLTTTYPGALKRHWNIFTGMWRPLDLQLSPFNFPTPLKIIDEHTTLGTDYKQKSLGLWRIEDLPV